MPSFGIRHEPARSEHFAEAPDLPHEVGGGDGGVELHPAALDALHEIVGPDHVGAGLARLTLLLAPAKTATRTVRPRPWGSTTAPRTIWSACLGSTPSRKDRSTDSSNLARAGVSLKRSIASFHRYCRSPRSWPLLHRSACSPSSPSPCSRPCRPAVASRYHLDAHAAGGALDDAHRRVHRVGVEINELLLGDLADLLLASPCRSCPGEAPPRPWRCRRLA